MKKLTSLLIGVVLVLVSTAAAIAADKRTAPKTRTLFTNVHVFDGKSESAS